MFMVKNAEVQSILETFDFHANKAGPGVAFSGMGLGLNQET